MMRIGCQSHSILHCCSLDKNSLSREALGFIAVCFSCDDQQHRFVWAAPDNPSPGPPGAGRPITPGDVTSRVISAQACPRQGVSRVSSRRSYTVQPGAVTQAQPEGVSSSESESASVSMDHAWSAETVSATLPPSQAGGARFSRRKVLQLLRY